MDAWPFAIPVCHIVRFMVSQGGDGSLKFPGYPCAHMPRSTTPPVSCLLAFMLAGL